MMHRHMRWPVTGTIVLLVLLLVSPVQADEDLNTSLQALQRLRRGTDTPLNEVDSRGAELLDEHSAPEAQAQIYYVLAHIHAQSGMIEADKVIRYAKEALTRPLEQGQRLRLFVYWGDAIRVRQSEESFQSRRAEAATVYFKGLAELADMELPAEAPTMPVMKIFSSTNAEEDDRLNREQWEIRNRIKHQTEMIKHRDVLIGQVSSIYQRPPSAKAELEELGQQALGGSEMLSRILDVVPDDPPSVELEPVELEPVELEQTSDRRQWVVLLILVVVAVVISLLALRPNRQKQ